MASVDSSVGAIVDGGLSLARTVWTPLIGGNDTSPVQALAMSFDTLVAMVTVPVYRALGVSPSAYQGSVDLLGALHGS